MRDFVLIHLHVPKCAGGAVNEVMRTHFGERLLHANGGKADDALAIGADRFDAVVGHLVWGVHRHFERPVRYFSAVREPVARICSFFNHMHTQPRAKQHARLKAHLRDLDELDDRTFERVPALRKRFANQMCRVYTGLADVGSREWDEVWPLIEERMAGGRLVVRDLGGIAAFLAAEGIHDGPLPQQKVTQHGRFADYVVARPERLKPATLDRLRALNQHDLRLMEVLRERGLVAD